jgi:hypothetical protein
MQCQSNDVSLLILTNKTFIQLYFNQMICHRTNSLNPDCYRDPLDFCRPFADGPAVFKARALYDFINFSNDVYYDEDCPEKGYSGRATLNDTENITLNELLAINETKKITKKINAEYILYPNPVNDKIFISSKISNSNLNITITDILGRVFVTKIIVINTFKWMLNLDLPNGIYFLSLYEDQKKLQTKKIIIAK